MIGSLPSSVGAVNVTVTAPLLNGRLVPTSVTDSIVGVPGTVFVPALEMPIGIVIKLNL